MSEACKAKLGPLCAQFESSDPDDVAIVGLAEEVIAILKAFKHYSKDKAILSCKQVGVHPKNRDGEGMLLSRVYSRGNKALTVRFSFTVLQRDTIAIEDNPHTKEIEKFTLKQCASIKNSAQYHEGEVTHGPLGATHMNHFIALVHDECPYEGPDSKFAEGGKVSQAKCFRDKGVQKATVEGIPWDVIDYVVAIEFPAIPVIIQRYLNVVASAAEGIFY